MRDTSSVLEEKQEFLFHPTINILNYSIICIQLILGAGGRLSGVASEEALNTRLLIFSPQPEEEGWTEVQDAEKKEEGYQASSFGRLYCAFRHWHYSAHPLSPLTPRLS